MNIKFLLFSFFFQFVCSVERERLRERDREARVKMTYEADQRGTTQDAFNSQPIFGEIVRVSSFICLNLIDISVSAYWEEIVQNT